MDRSTKKSSRGKTLDKRDKGPHPQCLEVAKRGIKTSPDFSLFMSCLMSDLISGAVSPGVGNAACNAGGKLLKVVEMQMRYGTSNPADGSKILTLAMGAAEHKEG